MDIKTLTQSNLRPDGATSGTKARNEPAEKERSSSPMGSAASESVTLTAAARSMNAAQASAGTAPFDEGRVADIKAAIADGRYQIDNQRLADRIIGMEQQISAGG